MPDLQTQQLMKQPPNNRIQKQMQDRSFLWCIQLISFHNACIIHGAMPLYMVLCHYTWCYAIIHGDMPFFRASEILKTKCQKALSRNKAFRQSWEQVANSSVDRASDWKARSNTDSGSNPRCNKGFLLPSLLWRRTLLRCSNSPREQSHASTSVCALTLSLPLRHHNYNVLDDVSAGKTS